MKFNGLCLLSVLLVSSLNVVLGHMCLNFKPMADFKMEKFLGPWFVTHTTLLEARCLVYDFYTQKTGNTPTNVGNTQIAHNTRNVQNVGDSVATFSNRPYIGVLEATTSSPANMSVSYPKYPVGKKPTFMVFDTDYETIAGLYIRQHKPEGGLGHSVTILSRSVDYDEFKVNAMIRRVNLIYNMELREANHNNCNFENINVNSTDQNVIGDDEQVYVSLKFMTKN